MEPQPEPVSASESGESLQSERTTVRRLADRGRYDRATVHAILDAGSMAHVGFVVDGRPVVLPMVYGRIDDVLYLHGAVGNAMLRAIDGGEVCVTVTHLDGFVLARSAFHHSVNYRSVVVLGTGHRVADEDEARRALDAVVDHVAPGRSALARPTSPSELRKTAVLRVAIAEASAKVRTGGPVDEPEDLDLAVWAGVVPLRVTAGRPEQDPEQASAIPGLEPPAADPRF